MSDKDKEATEEQPAAESPLEDVAEEAVEDVAEEAIEDAPEEDAAEAVRNEAPSRPGRGIGGSIGWLALFIALGAAAAAGYVVVQNLRAGGAADENAQSIRQAGSRVDSLQESLAGLESLIEGLQSDLGDLESASRRLSSSVDSVQNDLSGRTELFDSLPPRMSSLERSVAALQGLSIDARNTYLVAEAEYYMQIANAQLQLAGNPYLASLALEQADDRLLQLGDPALTDVRRALADERAALEVMEKPDIAGVALTLSSLARVVESLPVRSVDEETDEDDAASEEEPSGVSRAWNSVKGAFSGLVKHTPPGQVDTPLLTPEAEPLIRSNLSLQLQAARLALLRGEESLFDQSLEDADAWLSRYFDVGSEQVAGARQTLGEIREEYAAVAPPDISTSLRLLRQYKTLAEAQQ